MPLHTARHVIVLSGFLVGAVGDVLLQIGVGGFGFSFGLREYFARHGSRESVLIAGGLVAATTWVALLILDGVADAFGLEAGTRRFSSDSNSWIHTLVYLFLFGAVIDNAFRYGRILPSLDGMYAELSPPVSMFFAGGPLVLAGLIARAWVRYG
jgi:hypothetical protein